MAVAPGRDDKVRNPHAEGMEKRRRMVRKRLDKQETSKFKFHDLICADWTQLNEDVIIKFPVQGQIMDKKKPRVYLLLHSLFSYFKQPQILFPEVSLYTFWIM